MTPFEKTEEIIENANEEKLQLILSKLETSDKVTAEEKIKLREYVEVRRQILWFDSLPEYKPKKNETISTPRKIPEEKSRQSNPVVGGRNREDKSRVRVDEIKIRQTSFSDLHESNQTEMD